MNREYTATLAIAEQAADWLERLPEASARERDEFVAWLRESPVNVREFLMAIRCAEKLRYLDSARLMDIQAFVKLARESVTDIDDSVSNHQWARLSSCNVRAPARAYSAWYRRVAVGIAFVAFVSLMTIAIRAVSDRTISTGPGEWQTVRLVDGTMLHAGPRTQVGIDITDRERVLRLTRGEVMIYVAKDPDRPFLVNTELATARAIGTAFAVQSLEPDRVSITVKEGTVGVSRELSEAAARAARPGSESIVVKAGERTDVIRGSAPLHPETVDVDRELAWVDRKHILSGTIADAIHEFNRRNRTQIQLLDADIGERRLIGIVDVSDPVGFARMIEAQVPVSIVSSEAGTLLLASHADGGTGKHQQELDR